MVLGYSWFISRDIETAWDTRSSVLFKTRLKLKTEPKQTNLRTLLRLSVRRLRLVVPAPLEEEEEHRADAANNHCGVNQPGPPMIIMSTNTLNRGRDTTELRSSFLIDEIDQRGCKYTVFSTITLLWIQYNDSIFIVPVQFIGVRMSKGCRTNLCWRNYWYALLVKQGPEDIWLCFTYYQPDSVMSVINFSPWPPDVRAPDVYDIFVLGRSLRTHNVSIWVKPDYEETEAIEIKVIHEWRRNLGIEVDENKGGRLFVNETSWQLSIFT